MDSIGQLCARRSGNYASGHVDIRQSAKATAEAQMMSSCRIDFISGLALGIRLFPAMKVDVVYRRRSYGRLTR
jgi:hypothetical protein